MADESSDPGLITGNMIEAMIQAKLLVNAEQVAEAYRTVYATRVEFVHEQAAG